MEKEDARKQSREVLHERQKQVIRMYRKGMAGSIKDRVEIDFILESPGHQPVGIEVKATCTVTRDGFRGLKNCKR